MKRELAMEFSRTTEAAALAAHRFIGCGDKNAADGSAVEAMRYVLNQVNISGEVVIGEGALDEAPMLYVGEKVGAGGELVDIAVDPIDGTKMVAYGKANAVSTILACEKDKALKAPDMYMEKFVCAKRGVIDLDLPFEDNVIALSKALNKPLTEMVMVTMNRPRHKAQIDTCTKLGVKVFQFEDGDIIEAIKVFNPDDRVDFMYSIGGAPEGVIAAGIARAFDGEMQGRLVSITDVLPGDSWAEDRAAAERKECEELGLVIGKKLLLDDLINTDDVIFSATGITSGDILRGVTIKGDVATTESIIIRSKTGTIRKVVSTHLLNKKDLGLATLIKG